MHRFSKTDGFVCRRALPTHDIITVCIVAILLFKVGKVHDCATILLRCWTVRVWTIYTGVYLLMFLHKFRISDTAVSQNMCIINLIFFLFSKVTNSNLHLVIFCYLYCLNSREILYRQRVFFSFRRHQKDIKIKPNAASHACKSSRALGHWNSRRHPSATQTNPRRVKNVTLMQS